MRSITKKQIEIVKEYTRSTKMKYPYANYLFIEGLVLSNLPKHIFNVWEGSYNQIINIIMSTYNEA